MAALSGGNPAASPIYSLAAAPNASPVAPEGLSNAPDPRANDLRVVDDAGVAPADAMSPRLAAWFAGAGLDRAHLAIDLAAVGARYRALSAALAPAHIHYAVKANPEAPVLRLLAEAGANFDVASRGEIDMCLALGIAADRLSFGNTVKKRADIAHAYAKGVRIFAFDSAGELDKLADAAPGAAIYCRLLTDGAGADWPLSRKFGCADAMAEDLLRAAHGRGFTDLGLSFHVGSQQTRLAAWDAVLDRVAALHDRLAADGIRLSLVNIGGGFPARYRGPAPDPIRYAEAVAAAVAARFGAARPVTVIAEPGRGLVADAGVIEAEVMLVAEKGDGDPRRWVTLGLFGILCPGAIRYAMGKRSSNMMANWLLTACHSRTERFHSVEVAFSVR